MRAGDDAHDETWLEHNRAMWDDLARLHEDTAFYDLPGVVAGAEHLRPWEPDELGDVAGLDLLHLQCHIGTDTVGWARRGARVTGLDFSSAALEVAHRLSDGCDLDIEWVQADVHGAVDALAGRTFDVVYTGVGALCWLPDLAPWARVVRRLLRPGGVLYLTELHPMWMATWSDGRTICQHAIDAEFTTHEDEDGGTYADPEARLGPTVSHERVHTISDLLTAVLDAGLTIELFRERAVTPGPSPWLESGDDGLYRFPEGMYRFPLSFSLRARLPAD